MKKNFIPLIALFSSLALSSCHGVYVDVHHAESVYHNIVELTKDDKIIPQHKYTYSALEVDGDMRTEYKTIYSKPDDFYYHYRIAKVYEKSTNSWFSSIIETWHYVYTNKEGDKAIYDIERNSGTIGSTSGGCYDVHVSPYEDSLWAKTENEIYAILNKKVTGVILPLMETYIDMAINGISQANILFASSDANSLYIEASDETKRETPDLHFVQMAIENLQLASYKLEYSKDKYSSFSADFSKAIITYPNLTNSTCS